MKKLDLNKTLERASQYSRTEGMAAFPSVVALVESINEAIDADQHGQCELISELDNAALNYLKLALTCVVVEVSQHYTDTKLCCACGRIWSAPELEDHIPGCWYVEAKKLVEGK